MFINNTYVYLLYIYYKNLLHLMFKKSQFLDTKVTVLIDSIIHNLPYLNSPNSIHISRDYLNMRIFLKFNISFSEIFFIYYRFIKFKNLLPH